MALAIVREKELGSITNLYVTPVSRLEFLLGKQLPYIAVAMANFTLMFLMALFVFQVPLKGSFPTLLLGVLIYVTTMTGYGMLISAFTSTQIAALFGTAILTVLPATQFAGMMTPVSSLAGTAQIIGRGFPDDLFRADQRRHLHQRTGLCRPQRGLAGARGLHSDPDPAQRSAAAQTGTLGVGNDAKGRKHLLAGHQGTAQFPARFRVAGPGRLCIFAGDHPAGAEQFAGAA